MKKQSKILDRIEKQEDDRVRVQSEREILRLRAQIEDLQYRNKLLHDDLDLSERRLAFDNRAPDEPRDARRQNEVYSLSDVSLGALLLISDSIHCKASQKSEY